MAIDLDWEVTDAPSEGEAPVPREALRLPTALPPVDPAHAAILEPQPDHPPAAPRPTHRARRRLAFAIVAALILAGTATWYLASAGWRRVNADITTLVQYEERYSLDGKSELVLAVQDSFNPEWVAARSVQVDARQPAPLPLPRLELQPAGGAIVSRVEALGADWVQADVRRSYLTPGGQTLTFVLPQFYRRFEPGDWLHSEAPPGYWGAWTDWTSPHAVIRHSEPDAALVQAIGPALEGRLAAACALWGRWCQGALPARLYLSSHASALYDDPLDNLEMRVSFGDSGALPAATFVAVPSPHLSGLPAGSAEQQYLADYLAVRLIAALARRSAAQPWQVEYLIARAVQELHLGHADPGFATGEAALHAEVITVEPQPVEAPAGTPLARRAAPQDLAGHSAALEPTATPHAGRAYTVRAGDTLGAIAERFDTSLRSLAVVNDLDDPDLIFEGQVLQIP